MFGHTPPVFALAEGCRKGGHTSAVACREGAERNKKSGFFARNTSASAENDPAVRDCARDPFSTGAAFIKLSKNELQAVYP